MRHLGTVASRP